ncbi:MAG: outer membrane beta-barrel protein [Emcibacteraceae bacterium]|nr:outer membrane beta-barrel protein [Emcibacteraceae bacterium]
MLPAQFAFSQTSTHDGLYMGVEGSYSKVKNNSVNVTVPEFDGFYWEGDVLSETTRDPKYSQDGAAAGLFFGYRLSEGIYTLATEATYTNNFISNKVDPLDTFELSSEFGIAILPGVWVNDDVVLYGHLGASQLKVKSQLGSELFDTSDTGFIFGAGAQVYVNENLSICASYTRSTHDHKSVEFIDVFDIGGTLIDVAFFEYDSTLKRDKFAASLVYNF